MTKSPLTSPAQYRAFGAVTPIEFPPIMGNLEYSGWRDEQMSWKRSCYIGDWSFVPQIRGKGPDALRLFTDLSVNSFAQFPLNRAKHCVMCNEFGKVVVEGILLRHDEHDLEFEAVPAWVLYHLKTGGYDAEASYPMTHKLQVSGPSSLGLLEKLTETTLRDIKFMHTKFTAIGGSQVTMLRQGMAGEIGFELHGPIEQHDQLFEAVLDAGQEFGIRRLGRRTFHVNHVEARYPTTGMEYWNAVSDERRTDFLEWMDREENIPAEWRGTPLEGAWKVSLSTAVMGSWDGDSVEELYRSPIEMGWGKSVNFDHEFIGRAALEAEMQNPRRTVVTLEFNSDDMIAIYASLFSDGDTYLPLDLPHFPYIACWADWIHKDGVKVGHSTFPAYSYYFRKVIALSFIEPRYSEPGTEVTVLWGNPDEPQTEIRATVCRAPYKQDNRRGDLSTLAPSGHES
jgi:vanillate/3-O-methylgallate O-demethylase